MLSTLALPPVAPLPHAAPYAHHAAAFPASTADRLAKLAARRAVIVARCALLRAGLHHAPHHTPEIGETLRPVARQSARLIDAEPILSSVERARVRLDVEIARDADLWQIGRASPCYWLAPLSLSALSTLNA